LGVCLLEHYALSSRTNMPHAEFQLASQTGAQGLATCREIGSPNDLAFALHWNGLINAYGLDSARARSYLAEALALYEKQNNRLQIGILLATLGFIALSHGDLAAVRLYAHKGMQQAEMLKDKVAFYTASSLLGLAAYYEADYPRMRSEFEDTLSLGQATGNPTWRMFSLRNLGIAALHHGEWAQAAAYFHEQLALARKFSGYEYDLHVFLPCMAGVALGLGKLEQAARLLGATETLFATFFKPLDAWDQVEFDRIAAGTRQGMDEAAFAAAWVEGRELTLEQATREAESLINGLSRKLTYSDNLPVKGFTLYL
jgi:hypothetical protein